MYAQLGRRLAIHVPAQKKLPVGRRQRHELRHQLAGFLLAAGCSESDPREFVQPERLVRNLYLAPVMSVYAGQTLPLRSTCL